MSTLSAPRGVTKIAGANAYAAKFANSPTPTILVISISVLSTTCFDVLVTVPPHHVGFRKNAKPLS